MLVLESIVISGTLVLAYLSYARSRRMLKRIQRQCSEAERLNQQAKKRYREAVAFQAEALRVRDIAVKEAERLASLWDAEHLN